MQQAKVILVLIDGAGYQACVEECGYLEGLVEQGSARRWKMRTALPSISAPLYETIHTGLPPSEHGITCNEALQPSRWPNVFQSCVMAERKTAAVAHAYFFTLYSGQPYDLLRHVEFSDESSPIQQGRFYSMEAYGKVNICAPAEIDLCAQTLLLIEQHQPDYLLLHTCSVDSVGHAYGGESREYHKQIYQVDTALSRTVPRWLEQGYTVLVTADHGINAAGHHGGTQDSVRDIPLYVIGETPMAPEPGKVLDQCALAPSILGLLDIDIPGTMKAMPLFSL